MLQFQIPLTVQLFWDTVRFNNAKDLRFFPESILVRPHTSKGAFIPGHDENPLKCFVSEKHPGKYNEV